MIHLRNRTEIDAYFEDTEHLSQSQIKRILKGMDAYNKEDDEKGLYYQEKGHLIIGNGVDVLLTEGREEFDNQFHMATVDKPSGKTLSILMYLYDKAMENYEDQQIWQLTLENISDEDILLACDAEEFQKNWNPNARVRAIKKQSEFFDDLCRGHNKQIISAEEWDIIFNVANSLKKNELTKGLFEDNPNVDIYYQYPIYFEIDGIKCKVLIDVVVIDHNHNQITVGDIKTFGDYTINFPYQAIRMRYDIQASFYTEAVYHDEMLNEYITSKNYFYYPFTFVVESTVVQGNPLLYVCDKEFLEMGEYGRPESYSKRKATDDAGTDYDLSVYHNPIHGWKHALNEYAWHLEFGFEKDRIVKDGNGILNLGWGRSWL